MCKLYNNSHGPKVGWCKRKLKYQKCIKAKFSSMSNFNKNKTSNKKKIPDPKIHSLPQKNAVLYDMTLQTFHKQYHNSVRKYLRLYPDVSSTTNGKSNLFHVKKLSHKIFHVVSLAYGQNANCTFLFSIRICWFCWYCSNVRKANISLLPQEKKSSW